MFQTLEAEEINLSVTSNDKINKVLKNGIFRMNVIVKGKYGNRLKYFIINKTWEDFVLGFYYYYSFNYQKESYFVS